MCFQQVVNELRIEDSTLHIRVSNPGDLTSPANESSAKAGSSTGVGLRNASERLQLLYGDKATLRLVAEPVGCVTAFFPGSLPAYYSIKVFPRQPIPALIEADPIIIKRRRIRGRHPIKRSTSG